jgi:hypothetical protein
MKKLTYKDVRDTLSSIDVTDRLKTYKSGNVDLSYLPWADAVNFMDEHFPQWHPTWGKSKIFPNGTEEIYCKITIDDLYKEMWYPVTKSDSKTPLVNADCYTMNTNKMRGMVKCMAMFGLGIKVFTGESYEAPNPVETDVSDPILTPIIKLKNNDSKNKYIEDMLAKSKLEDGKVDEMQFGKAIDFDYKETDMPYIPNNLRASSFRYYAFGLRYKSKGVYTMSPAERKLQLQHDLEQKSRVIPEGAMDLIRYGNFNERSGIAKWMLVNKQTCQDYCSEQKNYVIEGGKWTEDEIAKDIAVSATPDGLSNDNKTIIEVKCSAMGNSTYDEFPRQYLPQIMGQMWIANANKVPVEQVDLVNWTPKQTKIWRIMRDEKYEQFLREHLSDYCNALKGGEFKIKLKPYIGDLDIKLIYTGE